MKIYTKKGDTGQTSLIDGKHVSKSYLRIDAYGTIDELNSYIGLLRDQEIKNDIKDILGIVQGHLFVIGAILSSNPEKNNKIAYIQEKDIKLLENEIDKISASLPGLKSFILPGGHNIVSICHVTRSVCRRSERIVVALNEKESVNNIIIKYLNRLSDYLFVLARKIGKDLNVKEITWKPEK